MKLLQPWHRRTIAISALTTVYLVGVTTAGWSPYWEPASDSARNGHVSGGLCPSDKRLLEIFRGEVWGEVDRIKRLSVNSCEYGWAMVQVQVVMANGESHDYMAMLNYDLNAKQWYLSAKRWLYSSGGGMTAL